MQEKLAEMKSKYMTKVAIRVKPVPDSLTLQQPTADDDELSDFHILNSCDMGLAKQIVINN